MPAAVEDLPRAESRKASPAPRLKGRTRLILAGVAIGRHRNVADAVAQLVKVAETIVPDQAIAESYKAQMEQYRVLYSSLAPLRRAHEICD